MTLIVLLILAEVSISGLFSEKGLFKRTEQGAEVYNRGKAREKLELILMDAQVIKHTEGLNDEQLTNKINEIGEELEERTNPDISQAIVDGYIFEIDRTVPKILDYLGKADGVIITVTATDNADNTTVASGAKTANVTAIVWTKISRSKICSRSTKCTNVYKGI